MDYKSLENENVVINEKDGIHYLQFRKLLEYDNLMGHAFSIGRDLNFRTAPKNGMDYLPKEEMDIALNNYKKLCSAIGFEYKNLIRPTMSHSDNVQIVLSKVNPDAPDMNIPSLEKTDGLITNKENLVLTTTGSDCITMIFFDPAKKVLGNVHSGWRGTLEGISHNAVEKLKENFNVDTKNLICCMAPAIRKCHFEVDKDVADMFYEKYKYFSDIDEIISKGSGGNPDKYYIDTIKININLLLDDGLNKENIIDSKICTVCNEKMINSFRAHKAGFGLNALIAGLR